MMWYIHYFSCGLRHFCATLLCSKVRRWPNFSPAVRAAVFEERHGDCGAVEMVGHFRAYSTKEKLLSNFFCCKWLIDSLLVLSPLRCCSEDKYRRTDLKHGSPIGARVYDMGVWSEHSLYKGYDRCTESHSYVFYDGTQGIRFRACFSHMGYFVGAQGPNIHFVTQNHL